MNLQYMLNISCYNLNDVKYEDAQYLQIFTETFIFSYWLLPNFYQNLQLYHHNIICSSQMQFRGHINILV